MKLHIKTKLYESREVKKELALIMELMNKIRYMLLLGCAFVLIVHKLNAQVEMSAKVKDGILKLEFCNKSDQAIKVPDLSVRYGSDKTHLFDNYYAIFNDTLVISLEVELDPKLYTIRSREQNDGETDAKLKYTDKVLLPGKRFRSKTRLKGTGNIRFLILSYEELKLESVVD